MSELAGAAVPSETLTVAVKHVCGWVNYRLRKLYRMQSTNSMFRWNVSYPIPTAAAIACCPHQLKAHAVIVTQFKQIVAGCILGLRGFDPQSF